MSHRLYRSTDKAILDAPPPKLFSKAGVGALYIGIVGLFLALQLLGVYLFAPYVFNEQTLTAAQRFGMGSYNGTVTSYAMIFTLVVLLLAIAALIKVRLRQVTLNSSTLPGLSHNHSVADYLAIKPFALRIALGIFGLWLLFMFATEAVTYWLEKDPTAFVDELYASADPKWLLIAVMVVAAPIYEEVMFRGILWTATKEQFEGETGVWVASLVTSILFAIIHLQYAFYEMSVIFLLALLLSYARAKSGSLMLPILIHMMNNGLAMWMYLNTQ